MGLVDKLPEGLVKAYLDLVRDDIKERLEKDKDYEEKEQ